MNIVKRINEVFKPEYFKVFALYDVWDKEQRKSQR